MNEYLSDEEMIRQYLVTQPDQCFATLYNRYVSKVYRRCLSMTKDPLQAEDFTHDIFLKAFRKLDAFQEKSTFSTWLYAISFNYCFDQIRLAKRTSFVSIDEELKHDVAESQESQLQEETLQLIKQALTRLSVKERALLKLKYEEELSVEAISKAYQLNPSTVKMRLKRSRDKVHRLYSQLANC